MAEREWREASDMRQSAITLAIILAAAAMLRFVGIGSGIPFNIGVDEPEIMDRAIRMMRTGDFNPHFFDYPGLYFYVQLAVACARFIIGATAGEWTSLDQINAADFYLWGRAVTAFLGTLTVFLVYQIGMRWGTRYAALAAGLMAVMPLHVRESHYVLTDVPLTFFVTLALLLTLRAAERERAIDFAWAGAAAGLAAATKYPGALSLLMPVIAAWMTLGAKPSRIVASLAVVAAAAAAFLLAAPYTVLDLPAFLNGYAHLAGYYSPKPLAEPAAVTYFKHLTRSMAWPAFLLLLVGIGLGAARSVRGPGRVRWTVTLVFPIAYYYFLSGQTLVFGRYLLPLLPSVCLLAAAGCVSGVSLLRRFDIPRTARTAIIAAITIAAVLPPAWASLVFMRTLTRTSTVELAHAWMLDNIPRGSSVVIETQALLTGKAFNAKNVPQLVQDYRAPQEYADYVQSGVEYIVASSQKYGDAMQTPHKHPELYAAYMRLFEQSHEIARFTPDAEHPGPELRIYKLK
ncbi:MAG TPA: phospholipid carrier-dependent glycosyltransferase [Vicinamibacterales bacterium]|nr:phospholipid carrier-dependent glycosyltransferase [Vicinamibacterales bacterium]